MAHAGIRAGSLQTLFKFTEAATNRLFIHLKETQSNEHRINNLKIL